LNDRGVHTIAVTYPIVEQGRGRLRFICSASHTRDDVDRTLEALIQVEAEVEAEVEREVEREVDEERRASGERASGESALVNDTHSARSGVEAWARAFSGHLEEALARSPGPTPHLALSVALRDPGEPITIVIDERGVTLEARERADLPFCSLRPTDARTLSSVCSSDVQGLLRGVCEGTCVLEGQVEPFIWLIGRRAGWRPATTDLAPASPPSYAFAHGEEEISYPSRLDRREVTDATP
jgi:hypothetical protein